MLLPAPLSFVREVEALGSKAWTAGSWSLKQNFSWQRCGVF